MKINDNENKNNKFNDPTDTNNDHETEMARTKTNLAPKYELGKIIYVKYNKKAQNGKANLISIRRMKMLTLFCFSCHFYVILFWVQKVFSKNF